MTASQTWGEFLTQLWDTEVFSWESFGSMCVLAIFFFVVRMGS